MKFSPTTNLTFGIVLTGAWVIFTIRDLLRGDEIYWIGLDLVFIGFAVYRALEGYSQYYRELHNITHSKAS